MMDYTETSLWKTAFAKKGVSNDKMRLLLCDELTSARKNAIFLLDKIRQDFPNLTIHDITHVDGLWQVASVICGENYQINPLEGFVLGCAFIMHDAALSYQAVGGQDKLRETIEWNDYFADYSKNSNLDLNEQYCEADFSTIRFLHAKYAESLYKEIFERDDHTKFYIIENASLRNHLGGIIGQIAASHHWCIDEVKKLGNQLPALSDYPNEWRINPIKLACILRCADAGHIDEGRAPDYLLKLLALNGVSRSHWVAQNRLSQIDTLQSDKSKVLIASNIDFEEKDFSAWNVACDAVQVLDHEIRISNETLFEIDKKICFQSKCVVGAESRENLSQYIRTKGWIPCDANIHISNVESLINNLGGEKLYGSDHKIEIVLRELIQNARDAICARRVVEHGFDGRIDISIEKKDGKYWFSVVDNGVGMSMQAIKDYLLNFGNSFWASDLAKKEYPGLRSSSFESVGTFGIGFYSVFMVASEVIVETRKFDASLDSNIRLKFPNGLCLRPIISQSRAKTTSVSTLIKFCLKDDVKWYDECKIASGYMGVPSFKVPYRYVLSRMTAGLDVNVYYSNEGNPPYIIHTNIFAINFDVCQWLKDISFASFYNGAKDVEYIDANWKRLKRIEQEGRTIGFAALNTLYQPYSSFLGVQTIGGLCTGINSNGIDGFIGVLFAEPKTARRDSVIDKIQLKQWIAKEYHELCEYGLNDNDRLNLPYILGSYGIDMSNELYLRVINCQGKIAIYNLECLLTLLKNDHIKLIFPLSSFSNQSIDNFIDYEKTIKTIKQDELLFVVERSGSFIGVSKYDKECPYNIWNCILLKAKELNYIVKYKIEGLKAYSRLEGQINAMVVDIE